MRPLILALAALLIPAGAIAQPSNPYPLVPQKNLADVRNPSAGQANLRRADQRAPNVFDDQNKGYQVGDQWCNQTLKRCWTATLSVAPGAALWMPMNLDDSLPLDIAAAAGYQAVGWWGTQLATRAPTVLTLNKAVDIWRISDGAIKTIGWAANGDADYAAGDAFCGNAISCEIIRQYDQATNITTGALIGNDATQIPGYNGASAVVQTGGSGCTNGSQTFTVAGGTVSPGYTAPTFTGTVAGGVLSGALTAGGGLEPNGSAAANGSYMVVPVAWTAGLGKSVVNTTGGGCGVQPTIFVTWDHRAPLWTKNRFNGHRPMTESNRYSPGDETLNTGLTGGLGHWLALPGVSLGPQNNRISFSVAQMQTDFSQRNTLMLYGSFGGDVAMIPTLGYNFAPNLPVPFFFAHSPDTPKVTYSSPSVHILQTGASVTTYTVGNQVPNTFTFVYGGATQTGGAIGSGGASGRGCACDIMHAGIFPSTTMAAATVAAMKAKLSLMTDIVPQSRDVVVPLGDSIAYGLSSLYGNNWGKYLLTLGLLPSSPLEANVAISGGAYINTPYDYTANFNTMWAPIYTTTQNFWVVITMGRNDLLVGPPASPPEVTVFNRAKVYSQKLAALGPNVHIIHATVLPDKGSVISDPVKDAANKVIIDAYNVLIRNCAMLPFATVTAACPNGGLGAQTFIELNGDPLWSNAVTQTLPNPYSADGVHTTDAGSQDMAHTIGATLIPLLNQ